MKDPHEVVKAGKLVKVRVLEVDIPRKRIGLSMRKESTGGGRAAASKNSSRDNKTGPAKRGDDRRAQNATNGTLGAAFLAAVKPTEKRK